MTDLVAAYTASIYILLQLTGGSSDIFQVLDKYGFPTAFLGIVLWFLWNRQKAADSERNGLISRNNELTADLLKAVKDGNQCHYKTIS